MFVKVKGSNCRDIYKVICRLLRMHCVETGSVASKQKSLLTFSNGERTIIFSDFVADLFMMLGWLFVISNIEKWFAKFWLISDPEFYALTFFLTIFIHMIKYSKYSNRPRRSISFSLNKL